MCLIYVSLRESLSGRYVVSTCLCLCLCVCESLLVLLPVVKFISGQPIVTQNRGLLPAKLVRQSVLVCHFVEGELNFTRTQFLNKESYYKIIARVIACRNSAVVVT